MSDILYVLEVEVDQSTRGREALEVSQDVGQPSLAQSVLGSQSPCLLWTRRPRT